MLDETFDLQISALGAFIREQRRVADLSLRELAALTRVSNAYLSQVERGLHQPSLKVLRAIADALEMAPAQLLASAGLLDPPTPRRGQVDAPDQEAPGRAERARSGEEQGVRPYDVGGTERAIRADAALTEPEKEALVAVYRSYLHSRTGDGAASTSDPAV